MMIRKKLTYSLLALLVVLTCIAGVTYCLHRFNVSFVFYEPGHLIDTAQPTDLPERYPWIPDTTVNKVILFIGDGVGVSHLTAARLHFYGAHGRLHIERMPVTGLVANHSANNLITDSAASATAMATGVKTKNGMVGMDVEGNARKTILEAARDAGFATGLVTSTQLTDATPACFASHVRSRGMKSEIALQLVNSGINVLLGEGEYFYPAADKRSKRQDERDPIEIALRRGYTFVDNRHELQTTETDFLLGIFEGLTSDRMNPDLAKATETPALSELTEKALQLLNRNQRGFFLMVEEEGVDLGSHVNRSEYFLQYLRNFDAAVRVGLEFAMQDQQTLVIVTSDHETGGMNIVNDFDGRIELQWDTDRHTGQPVPLFAFGPRALRFTGLMENTEIPVAIAELLGLESFLELTLKSSNEQSHVSAKVGE